MKISTKARNAICLGTLCSVAYLAVYIARNILGTVTPKMTADAFSLDYIGDITAIYLLAYACGQLINGTIGDWIKAKYMICIGLLSAGIANIIFVRIAAYPGVASATPSHPSLALRWRVCSLPSSAGKLPSISAAVYW